MQTWRGDDRVIALAQRTLGPGFGVVGLAIDSPGLTGWAVRDADASSDFEIGSISKAITGQLYRAASDDGVLTPATTLGDLLPLEASGAVAGITLESLSVHRSGLPSLPPAAHPWRRTWELYRSGANPYGDTLADLLEQVRAIRLKGPQARYSNLGFQLLGHAVAAARGTRYTELVAEAFGPGLWVANTETDLRATSLRGVSRFGRPRDPWVGEALGPAGAIRASMPAMAQLLGSLLAGSAVGMGALDPVSSFTGTVRIGAGWITLDHQGRTVTWHNGGTGGFRSWIGLDRAAGAGLAVVTATERSVDSVGFRLLTDPARRA